MPLLSISDPETLKTEPADAPHALPRVKLPGTGFDWSILKFSLHSCCEVLGYQLAPRLRVSMMPVVPVWCPHAFGHGGQAAGEGRVGLAVQYSETFEQVTWEQAATQSPEAAAASLALCLLDRHEWGQFAASKFGLVFYDLEGLFPAFCPERMDGQTWDDVALELGYHVDPYRSLTPSVVEEVLDTAADLKLTELVRRVVADVATISTDELKHIFDLEPHPLGELIERMAADVAIARFKHAARLLSV